ncbi:MAG: hypothetical protein MUF34_28805 [Polyangiaceae bacterium]|nr:hypothetical protein [Polyangiaceae bacterium]
MPKGLVRPPEAPAPRPRAGGRPRKAEPPRIPWDEVDALLVFGESVPCADGLSQATRYPSYRDLGERYGCASSVICDYSVKHNCLRRRAENELHTKVKADQKVVELRATAIAFARDDEVRVIDTYLAGFEKALAEGRVRFDNPSDFNTMLRLKSFLLGGADSRQEVTATLSLEALQARHRQMLRGAGASAAEQGLVEGRARSLLTEGHEVPGPGESADQAGGWAEASRQEGEAADEPTEDEGDSKVDGAVGPPAPAPKPNVEKPSGRFSTPDPPDPEETWDRGGPAAASRPPRRAPSWASTPLDPALTGYRPRRPEGAAERPPWRGDRPAPPAASPEGVPEEPSARRGRGSRDG